MSLETNIGAPVECNFERRTDMTKDIIIRLKSKATGLPLDVTGFTAVLTMDPSPNPPDNTNNVFTAPGAPVVGQETDGQISFDFAGFATAGVAPNTYFYDVCVTDPAGDTCVVLIGKYIIKQKIS